MRCEILLIYFKLENGKNLKSFLPVNKDLKKFNLVLYPKPEIFKLVLTFWIWHNILVCHKMH